MSNTTKTTKTKKGRTTGKEVTTERRRLQAHENLIIQVIKRQAGTLSKAVLEGVMNSIDAFDKMERAGIPFNGTPKIGVFIKANQLRIIDNAMGFESADSIKQVFEVFGNPHELDDNGISKDAKFGTFRIGRGQMFAFGRNTWRSNEFQMVTDIDNKDMELDYDLDSGLEKIVGCDITVDLYDALKQSEIQSTIDEVTKYCRYVPYDLTVNGQQIAADPAKMKWDVETEDAYINKKVVESRWRYGSGLDVYQQGVFVESLPATEFGLEGTIVIRKAVQVNFARNQVIRRCPQWKKISKLLKQEGVEEAKKKARLTSYEARRFVENFANGEDVKFDDFWNTACLPDTNGKMWSCDQLRRLANSNAKQVRIHRNPLGQLLVCFDSPGSREADRVMQRKLAIVLDEKILTQLRVDNSGGRKAIEEKALNIIRGVTPLGQGFVGSFDRFHGKLALGSVAELMNDAKSTYHLISKDEQTSRERAFLSCAVDILRSIDHRANGWDKQENRKLIVGVSDMADGWTDGSTYVAINRKYIAGLNLGLERDWHKAASLILHEFCHKNADTDTHNHTPEFYEDFHDGMDGATDRARWAYQTYRKIMQHGINKLPKQITNQLHIEAETYVLDQLLYTASEQEETKKREAANA